MSRRDTIIIAVLINAGLLIILFVTAMRSDDDKKLATVSASSQLVEAGAPAEGALATQGGVQPASGDDVDQVLQQMAARPDRQPSAEGDSFLALQTQTSTFPAEMTAAGSTSLQSSNLHTPSAIVSTPSSANSSASGQTFVKVTVKRGDVLEKIAKTNRTSVDAIIKANDLRSTQLRVGQILQVPVASHSTAKKNHEQTAAAASSKKPVVASEHKKGKDTASKDTASLGPQKGSSTDFHVIKSGDSPKSIASKHGLKVEDLLRLNGLDQTKARHLKVGDRLRVR